jgi:[ribosomal protein S5]-alanine N-acetyltransferase|eukprot:6974551-Prymnesium_polylepis.2
MVTPLPTRRLAFRLWRATDGHLAYGLWGDREVNTLLGNMRNADRKMTDARLAMEIKCAEVDGAQYWPVYERTGGEHVGAVGLRRKGAPSARCWELGVHLRKAFWGRGLASEAAASVATHGFDVLKAASLFGGHHPDNAGSARMLASLGFVYTHDGEFDGLPDRCYSLTPEAWKARLRKEAEGGAGSLPGATTDERP